MDSLHLIKGKTEGEAFTRENTFVSCSEYPRTGKHSSSKKKAEKKKP